MPTSSASTAPFRTNSSTTTTRSSSTSPDSTRSSWTGSSSTTPSGSITPSTTHCRPCNTCYSTRNYQWSAKLPAVIQEIAGWIKTCEDVLLVCPSPEGKNNIADDWKEALIRKNEEIKALIDRASA